VSSTVTIPVGTAMIAYPSNIINDARNFPSVVMGKISPYPTVVIVTMHQ
jgi:hypothetical protein